MMFPDKNPDNERLVSVYSLDPVANVCEQTLREVLTLNGKVSLAHVLVNPEGVSLLHHHERITEVYFVLSGEGRLFSGDRALGVSKESFLIIPPGVPHKLRNLSAKDPLEHLVISSPPFSPEDVNLDDDSKSDSDYEERVFSSSAPWVEASDDAKLQELISGSEAEALGFGLAFGFLPAGKKATIHYHKVSAEVYYVVSGSGFLNLNGSVTRVREGQAFYVPVNTLHGLDNSDTGDSGGALEILCISSPPYKDSDFLRIVKE